MYCTCKAFTVYTSAYAWAGCASGSSGTNHNRCKQVVIHLIPRTACDRMKITRQHTTQVKAQARAAQTGHAPTLARAQLAGSVAALRRCRAMALRVTRSIQWVDARVYLLRSVASLNHSRFVDDLIELCLRPWLHCLVWFFTYSTRPCQSPAYQQRAFLCSAIGADCGSRHHVLPLV